MATGDEEVAMGRGHVSNPRGQGEQRDAVAKGDTGTEPHLKAEGTGGQRHVATGDGYVGTGHGDASTFQSPRDKGEVAVGHGDKATGRGDKATGDRGKATGRGDKATGQGDTATSQRPGDEEDQPWWDTGARLRDIRTR